MIRLFKSQLGRLRIISYLEGMSLLVLLFVAVPLKYYWHEPAWVKTVGPIHGALFIWFIFSTLSLAIEEQWKFRDTTWKVLIACMIPFGTFYIEKHLLRKIPKRS